MLELLRQKLRNGPYETDIAVKANSGGKMTLLRTVALLTAADEIGVVASVLSNGDWTEPTGYPWSVIQYIGLGR